MSESRKMASVTKIFDDDIGVTMFTPEEDAQEALDYGLELGYAIGPYLYSCALRHIDEFEEDWMKEFIRCVNDGMVQEEGSAE